MTKLFNDYVSGKIKMIHHMNLLINSDNGYNQIGKYFYEKYQASGLKNDSVDFIIGIKSNELKHNDFDTLGIYFITSFLDEKTLVKLFARGIKHSEFGEGFHPKRKYEFISYMKNVNGVLLHIGVDDRGTKLEAEAGTTFEELIDAIKVLIDNYCDLN